MITMIAPEISAEGCSETGAQLPECECISTRLIIGYVLINPFIVDLGTNEYFDKT